MYKRQAYDAKVGLHSVPAKFGIAGALRIAKFSHMVMLGMLALLAVVGRSAGLGWLFWVMLVVIAALVVRQHSLVKPDDLDRVNQAFFDTNAAISLSLLVVGTIDWFLGLIVLNRASDCGYYTCGYYTCG